ncbi:protein lurp-one-related 7 [Quercus suber]|uniref:Protein lurp-one-related 7 n=1 Tax=Quercus suber TaxID=58331 RepID=A0AAW0KS11_QUESU
MTSLAHSPIPVVLFVLKKHPDLTGGDLRFKDTSGDVIFKVNHQSSHNNKRPFLHSNRNPLISIYGYHSTVNKLTRTELEVFHVGENGEDSAFTLKVKGCSFQKSYTIYRGNDIVAQTSLMYKLRQL